MLPVLSATIRHFETHHQQTSGLDPKVRKALKRRERLKHRRQNQGGSRAVFKVGVPLCRGQAQRVGDSADACVSLHSCTCKATACWKLHPYTEFRYYTII